MPAKVTDPELLALLNGTAGEKKKVTDPALLAQLNGAPDQALQAGRGGRVSTNIEDQTQPSPLERLNNTLRAAQTGAMQGMTLGWDDEINAGMATPLKVGADLIQGRGFDPGRAYNEELDRFRDTDKTTTALNPIAATVGEVGGGLLTAGGVGSAGLSLTSGAKSIPGLLARGIPEGAAYGGAYSAGKDEGDIGSKARAGVEGAKWGAGTGALFPLLARGAGAAVDRIAQNRATSAAIKGAPSAADLSDAASAMFQSSKSAGVAVKPQTFGTFARDLARNAHAADIDKELDPGAWRVYERLVDMAKEGFQDPAALTLSRLHNLRQAAQDVVIEAKKPRTKLFSQNVVEGLDNLISGLKPGDLNLPPTLNGSAGLSATNALLDGISTWARAKKVGLVEEALFKAGNHASGLENGLRVQFRALVQNPKTRKQFTKTELDALMRVANGTATSNIVRLVGKFGFGGGSASNGLGGFLGASAGFGAAGVPGAIAAALLGYGARKLSSGLANKGAERAAKIVATPNIPQVQPIQWPQLGGAGVPLLAPAYPKTN